jgi:hypothetical protein
MIMNIFKIIFFFIFQNINEYDDNVNNVCAKFKYSSTEARVAGFTGNLSVRHQRVKALTYFATFVLELHMERRRFSYVTRAPQSNGFHPLYKEDIRNTGIFNCHNIEQLKSGNLLI